MTEPDTATTAADPYVCEHCDDSVPHQHVDEKPLVERYRRDLLRAVLAASAVGLVSLAVMAFQLGSAIGMALGVAAWLLSTAVGVLVMAVLRTRMGTAAAVIVGAVGSAAVSPLLALVTGLLVPGSPGWAGLAGMIGWLVAGNVAAGIRAGTLRRLLIAHTRPGEAARSAVVRSAGRPSPYVESVWLLATAIVFGVCVAATAALPLVVIVLVPLNAALAVLSRRWLTRSNEAQRVS